MPGTSAYPPKLASLLERTYTNVSARDEIKWKKAEANC
jgi:hypothetical protein